MSKYSIPAWSMLLVAVVAATAGAVQEFELQIEGHWRGDPAKTQNHLKIASPPSESEKIMLAEIAKLAVEFGGKHAVIVHEGGREAMRGTWELIKDVDGEIEIDLVQDGQEEAARATVEFLDNHTVAISVRGEPAIVFSREDDSAKKGVVDQLTGTWECDKAATTKLESTRAYTPDQMDDMLQEAGNTTVTFRPDGSFIATMLKGEDIQELNGTWKTSNVDEAKKTFELAVDVEFGPQKLTVEMREDGSLLLSPPNQPSAVFVRRSEQPKSP